MVEFDSGQVEVIAEEQPDETPVCLRCFQPVSRYDYYCPHCGNACGQLTQYIPFLNIRWQVNIWGQMWRQVLSRDVSIPGRFFRLFMIIWCVPILLIGLFFRKNQKEEDIDGE